MIGYASRTGTKRNLEALRKHGWRLLVTPACPRTEGFRYALDNGAWSAYQAGKPFDKDAFSRLVDKLGAEADWIVVPDIVAGGLKSLEFSLGWLPELKPIAPVLIAVQDGMELPDVAPYVGPRVGLFVGGTSDWKLASLASWGALAAHRGCHLHVGRVNTRRRLNLCAAVGADSFDGTSVSRFATTIHGLDNARRQPDLLAPD